MHLFLRRTRQTAAVVLRLITVLQLTSETLVTETHRVSAKTTRRICTYTVETAIGQEQTMSWCHTISMN